MAAILFLLALGLWTWKGHMHLPSPSAWSRALAMSMIAISVSGCGTNTAPILTPTPDRIVIAQRVSFALEGAGAVARLLATTTGPLSLTPAQADLVGSATLALRDLINVYIAGPTPANLRAVIAEWSLFDKRLAGLPWRNAFVGEALVGIGNSLAQLATIEGVR